MAGRLEKRVCIVTGASRGIGRAIAVRLAREGAFVTAVARDAARLEDLRAAAATIRPLPCDVTDEARVAEVVDLVLETHGRLDVLVNNAGVGAFGAFEETSYDDFLRVLRVNAGGTFLFSRAAVKAMKRQRDGDIINISSVVGVKGYAQQAAYGASKHAVMGLTRALAREVHADGIRVRSICPGGVDTELIAAARPDLDRSGLIQPDDIADLVVFLLSLGPTAMVDNLHVRRPGAAPDFF